MGDLNVVGMQICSKILIRIIAKNLYKEPWTCLFRSLLVSKGEIHLLNITCKQTLLFLLDKTISVLVQVFWCKIWDGVTRVVSKPLFHTCLD